MKQIRIPAAFMRGGTSKAVMFHQRDLPAERRDRDALFIGALGSPDRYGRQLDGMGGGLSSLSKVCIVGPATHPDADVDYTFAQVQISKAAVDYSAMCGNMASAIGPFAIDEGLLAASGPEAMVRIHNTNTGKLVHAHFRLDEGLAAVDGELEIPGVGAPGSMVRLEFREPGGAITGRLLPTGKVIDTLTVPEVGAVRASLVDAGIAACFLDAADLGLAGTELPDVLERSGELLARLERIRVAASLAMGLARTPEEAARRSTPFVGFVSGPRDATLLSGETSRADSMHLTGRMLSNGQPHRALPLTASLAMAVAARITGTVVNQVARLPADPDGEIGIGTPSGVIATTARVQCRDGQWHAAAGGFCRTQRRLFDGHVYVRARDLNPA